MTNYQGPKIGFFDNHTGASATAGSAQYNDPSQEYLLTGSHFSFLWKEMDGDFIIQARIGFIGAGGNANGKAGLMIRSGFTSEGAHISCSIDGNGYTSAQFRNGPDGVMENVGFDLSGADVLQLEKSAEQLHISVAQHGSLYEKKTMDLDLGNELQAGLFISGSRREQSHRAMFSNVRVFGTAPEDLKPYGGYIGSLLETLDVESGQRHILSGAPGSWQAPNWTPDEESLIYNADGLLHVFNLATGRSEVMNSGFAKKNNNDHVISFEGTIMAISHHSEEDTGESVIYTLPLEGGTPRRITPLSPSYLHGWSADDQYLVYTGAHNEAYDIYRISVEGGEEQQLTDFPTLDDGPEYSPDGKYIYFNSCRTGTMQIWRMDTDGENQTQLTFDEYQDWFPHTSPNNRWIVFISYPAEVPAGDHPFYKQVYLRIMSVYDMKPRVIGYLYGGQGSMNVPSWSPDSKKIAFISNGIFE